MMSNPICTDDEKAEKIAEKIRHQFHQRKPKLPVLCIMVKMRNFDFDNQKRYRNGKNRVAEKKRFFLIAAPNFYELSF